MAADTSSEMHINGTTVDMSKPNDKTGAMDPLMEARQLGASLMMLAKVVGGWDAGKITHVCQQAEGQGVDRGKTAEVRRTQADVRQGQQSLRQSEISLARAMNGTDERRIRKACEAIEQSAVQVGGLISEARKQVRELRS